MAMAQKYKVGMYLGPDNIYFKEELPKKRNWSFKKTYTSRYFYLSAMWKRVCSYTSGCLYWTY